MYSKGEVEYSFVKVAYGKVIYCIVKAVLCIETWCKGRVRKRIVR